MLGITNVYTTSTEFLPAQPPRYWNHRHSPPCLALALSVLIISSLLYCHTQLPLGICQGLLPGSSFPQNTNCACNICVSSSPFYCVLVLFVCIETESHYYAVLVVWNSLSRPFWPQTHRNPLASAFQKGMHHHTWLSAESWNTSSYVFLSMGEINGNRHKY